MLASPKFHLQDESTDGLFEVLVIVIVEGLLGVLEEEFTREEIFYQKHNRVLAY